jgi:TPR repeat protein
MGISTQILFFSLLIVSGQSEPGSANLDYSLSIADYNRLELEANAGSGDAAIRLSDYHFYDQTPGLGKANLALAERWALVGAENGAPTAQFRVFQLFRIQAGKPEQVRAMYWLRIAADKGFVDAKDYLEECPTIESRHLNDAPCFGPDSL